MKQRKDLVALTFGLIFVGVVVWWLIGELLNLTIPNAGFLAAAALLFAGVIGLLSTLRRPTAEPVGGDPAEGADRPETDPGSPDTGAGQVDPTTDESPADPVRVSRPTSADPGAKVDDGRHPGPDDPR